MSAVPQPLTYTVMADCTTLSLSKMSKTPDQLDSATGDSDHAGPQMGHDQEELPRQFSLLSTLALGFSMTNSWLGYSATFITPLLMGGSPAVFFGLVGASIASSFISMSSPSLLKASLLTCDGIQRRAWPNLRRRIHPAEGNITLPLWLVLRDTGLRWPLQWDG